MTTCPLCQTVSPIITDPAVPTEEWQCVRCGQKWTASRLATAAAYTAYATRP